MMRLCLQGVLVVLAIGPGLGAAEVSRADALERRPLFAADAAKGWAPAECTVEASPRFARGTDRSWHWHVTVDHFAGEAKYPVGWPRIDRALPEGAGRDWSEWDFLHFWIYTETSRDALPRDPAGLGLHTPDRTGAYHRPLPELRKGQWVEYAIPVNEIPRAQDVRRIQFHIAESNYRHGDQLDFYLSDLALLRFAAPAVQDLAAVTAVVFADAARLPVRFTVVGVKPGEQVAATCELRRDGRVVRRISTPATRGRQERILALGPPALTPGTYELAAGIGDRAGAASATLRVVESPWP